MQVPHPSEVLYGRGVVLACALDGEVRADDLHGLFARDTRVLSTYRLSLAGQKLQLLGRQRTSETGACWTFQNAAMRDPQQELAEGCVFLRVERHVSGALRDDITVYSYARGSIRTTLVIQLDADFADIFEVRNKAIPPRLGIRRVPGPGGVRFVYEHGGFRRALDVKLDGAADPPEFGGTQIIFDLVLRQGEERTFRLEATPEVDGEVIGSPRETRGPEASPAIQDQELVLHAPSPLQDSFERGRADLHALALPQADAPPYVAAGVPWFYTLFGRDSLLPALMTGLMGSWPAKGALAALAGLQAGDRDDWRDAEPGKLPHELRHGELAELDLIPHTPYYGSHDAPALYCLALWNAWRWTGEHALLDAYLEPACDALRWCDELGDRDHDGLQEYETRSRAGYYNQSWKDAGDAIVHEDGSITRLPVATVELQGYLYAARLAVAELLEERGDDSEADRLRSQANELRALVEERFWLADSGFYALALDGEKRLVASTASNPGHLLWTGLPSPARARAVARRLLHEDLFSGWGLRTLSSEHARYNPLSYQRGSVWPHDTALAAAGMWRYGMRDEAATLIRALLEAACAFEDDRLPELFCGFDRSVGPPVPYREANVPQAWASAAPVLAVQLFLGLVPDAARGRCFVAPWLPAWLPYLEVRGIAVGEGWLDVSVAREEHETVIKELRGSNIEPVSAHTSAALWGHRRP